MADIVLSHGYLVQEDPKEQAIMRPYPPLGLLYLSAYLKRAGFSVDVADGTLGTRHDLHAVLASRRAPVLGLYTNLITRRSVLALIAEARRQGWTVVLGGPESANYPAEYLQRGADVVVVGEGEITLAALLPALSRVGPHRLHDVDGVVFRDEHGAVVTTPPRAQVADRIRCPGPIARPSTSRRTSTCGDSTTAVAAST